MKTQRLTEFFLRRPALFWSAVVAMVLAGIYSFMMMPKLEDPAVAVKQAMVVAMYPGASAHEVELKVAQVLEDQIRTMPYIDEIRSECQPGQAMITAQFKMTMPAAEVEQYFDLLRRKINDISAQLPSGCYTPVVVDDLMDVYGIFYGLRGPGYEISELEEYAKLIRRELLTVEGVKRIVVEGGRSEVINITLSKDKIARNGLIPTQIMMQLSGASSIVNGGKFTNGDDRIQLRVNDAVQDENDIRDLLISTIDGKQMRLGDIAQIERAYAEPQTRGFFVEGEPAMAICLSMEPDAVVPDVGKAVDAKLAEVMKRLPAGMTTQKIFFQPDQVDKAISGFMVNLLESVLIVIVVLMISMGLRSGLIIGIGLVLTIAVSFPILYGMDTTLQRISLGAFIIAMGMLVDNSIVIMDGILVDKKRGLGPKTYLYRIGNNTALPLLAATVIALSTFLSTFLSPTSAGEYTRDLFLVICVSLLASWVLAMVQVPYCAKVWLPAREKADGQKEEAFNSPMHRFVKKALAFLIDYKKTTIACAVAFLVICMASFTQVKNLFFPDFDYRQFVIEYQMPDQTSPDRVRQDLLEITRWLQQNDKVQQVAASMGSAPAHYCLVRPMTNGGESYGELMVDCKDFNTVKKLVKEIRPQLREMYPDAYIRFRHYNFSIMTSHTVEVRFYGPDPAVLRQLSAQAEDIMRQSKYADPYSVQNNWKPKGKALVADFVQADALRAGMSRSNVADALMAATDGLPVGVLNDKEKMVIVNLNVRNEDGSKITNLQDIPVWTMANVSVNDADLTGIITGATKVDAIQDRMFRAVPLSDVTSDVHLDWEEDLVFRVNGQRSIEAECDPNTLLFQGTAAKLKADIEPAINAIPLPEGYSRQWVGEYKTQSEGTYYALLYMPAIMIMIVFILLLLFNNWFEVLMVLLCLPFMFCGIVPALLIFRQPFTFMAIVGLLGMIGMMVKNGIVLVDEINRLYKEEHRHPYDAVVTATTSRVRPVVMASLTTILGMAPLLGDPMYGSMAICIMAGLTVGTLITLVLLPIIYCTLFRVTKPQTEEAV